MKVLKASVQYGDWKGTAAADNADLKEVENWLIKNNHTIGRHEQISGIDIRVGENDRSGHRDPIQVKVLVSSLKGSYSNLPEQFDDQSDDELSFRCISVDMELVDFFGLFKRFNIVLLDAGSQKVLEERFYRCK